MSQKDEEKNIPDPVFKHGENFSSAYFGKLSAADSGEGNSISDQKLISNFIGLLVDPNNRELKAEVLNILRNAKAQQFLVDLIDLKHYEKHRKELIMACWESGMNFSMYLIFFAELAANCEYPEAIEALTVIDEMHDFTDIRECEKAIKVLTSETLSADRQLLNLNTVTYLRTFLG